MTYASYEEKKEKKEKKEKQGAAAREESRTVTRTECTDGVDKTGRIQRSGDEWHQRKIAVTGRYSTIRHKKFQQSSTRACKQYDKAEETLYAYAAT